MITMWKIDFFSNFNHHHCSFQIIFQAENPKKLFAMQICRLSNLAVISIENTIEIDIIDILRKTAIRKLREVNININKAILHKNSSSALFYVSKSTKSSKSRQQRWDRKRRSYTILMYFWDWKVLAMWRDRKRLSFI